ncbi:unnamed protein product [Didymodactylos carnosus]|uniref:Uncharacterized protein n=1 Tax=Didymodactylos carnosus TaxID=1234261 RepID=A0A814FI38_9BILA|nr:unnamed protein product [Didymodactylos carnosus]CAF3753510.1 unnamed protein product [Didymodactylos carnosus]
MRTSSRFIQVETTLIIEKLLVVYTVFVQSFGVYYHGQVKKQTAYLQYHVMKCQQQNTGTLKVNNNNNNNNNYNTNDNEQIWILREPYKTMSKCKAALVDRFNITRSLESLTNRRGLLLSAKSCTLPDTDNLLLQVMTS